MRQTTRWCLVCDASRAHLFREGPAARPYELIASFDHPESRSRVGELVTDAQGRKPVGGSHGDGAGGRPGGFHGHPTAEPETDPKEIEAMRFARDLASVLEKGLNDRAYEALLLIAPPRFLGLIRATLNEQVTRRVEGTIDKDLAALAPREIERRLRQERVR